MLSSARFSGCKSLDGSHPRTANEQQSYKGPATVCITFNRSRCVGENCKAGGQSQAP